MIINLILCNIRGVFEVENYDFYYNSMSIWLIFEPFNREISKLNEKGHEPSQAENCSARVLAQASSARTHHQYVSTNVHDLVFWHALALLIKGITSFVQHPIAFKYQSTKAIHLKYYIHFKEAACSTQPFWQIKDGLVPGRLPCTSIKT